MWLDDRAHGSGLLRFGQELGQPRADRDRIRDPVRIPAPELQALEPLVELVRRKPPREHGEPKPPRRRRRDELFPRAVDLPDEPHRLLVRGEVRMDRAVDPELGEPTHRVVHPLLG